MHANQKTIENLYAAFAQLDAKAMAKCYAPDAAFDDEVFSLRGRAEVSGMWHMLCDAVKAHGMDVWKLESRDIKADAKTGTAHWQAWYRFSATGRLVHNIIEGEFAFNQAGLIQRHRDRFNFWRWSGQALGLPGVLLGWTPFLRKQVRQRAHSNLQHYLAAKPDLKGSS